MYVSFEMEFEPESLRRKILNYVSGVQSDEGKKRAEKVQRAARLDCGYRTGALAASIRVWRVSVARTLNTRTEIWTVGSQLSYALLVHDGVQRSYVIFPKSGKALRFFSGGQMVFASHVNRPAPPGTKGKFYLTKNLWRAVT